MKFKINYNEPNGPGQASSKCSIVIEADSPEEANNKLKSEKWFRVCYCSITSVEEDSNV